MALLAGYGFHFLEEKTLIRIPRPSLRRIISISILSFIFLDLTCVNSTVLEEAFVIPPLKLKPWKHFIQIGELPMYDRSGWLPRGKVHPFSSWSSMYPAFLSHWGTIYGYRHIHLQRRALPRGHPDYRGEVFVEGVSGNAEYSYWSPNRLRVRLSTKGKGVVVINQNYFPGWKIRKKGEKAINFKGLIGAEISEHDTSLEFYYLPKEFIGGCFLSLTGVLVGAISLFIYKKGAKV